jgi:hypothetical protein
LGAVPAQDPLSHQRHHQYKFSVSIRAFLSYFGFRCATPAIIVSFSSEFVSCRIIFPRFLFESDCLAIVLEQTFHSPFASAFFSCEVFVLENGSPAFGGDPFGRAGIVHSDTTTLNGNKPYRAFLCSKNASDTNRPGKACSRVRTTLRTSAELCASNPARTLSPFPG